MVGEEANTKIPADADTKPLITRVKQHCPAACKAQGTHAATQTQLAQSFLLQNSTSASYNLTGQRDMLVGHQLPPEYAAFNSVSPSASHILMLIVSHQPPWLSTWCWLSSSPCGNTGCTHGVGDSKSSRHMLPQMKTGDPSQHSHPLSVHSFSFSLLIIHPYL